MWRHRTCPFTLLCFWRPSSLPKSNVVSKYSGSRLVTAVDRITESVKLFENRVFITMHKCWCNVSQVWTEPSSSKSQIRPTTGRRAPAEKKTVLSSHQLWQMRRSLSYFHTSYFRGSKHQPGVGMVGEDILITTCTKYWCIHVYTAWYTCSSCQP